MIPEKKFIPENNIYIYENFITQQEAADLVEFYQTLTDDQWDMICFYQTFGTGLLKPYELDPTTKITGEWMNSLVERLYEAVQDAHGEEVKHNTIHAQKYEIGAVAHHHSDNSNIDGSPSGWMDNKYYAGLYLNDNYKGGILNFRDTGLELQVKPGTLVTFSGGVENIHGVSEILEGTRYVIMSFWDSKNKDYTEEEWEFRKNDIRKTRILQFKEKEEWAKGNPLPEIENPYEEDPNLELDELGRIVNYNENGERIILDFYGKPINP